MNKNDYINELESNLKQYRFSQSEIDEIIKDYTELYEDALNRGLTDDEVYKKLGNPKDIVNELKGDPIVQIFKPKHSRGNFGNVIIAMTPMICVITFLLLGFLGDLWYPGWLVFLAIPIVNILISSRLKFPKILAPLSPFISLTAFIILGYFGYWHPGWLVWFLVPLCGALGNISSK